MWQKFSRPRTVRQRRRAGAASGADDGLDRTTTRGLERLESRFWIRTSSEEVLEDEQRSWTVCEVI